jgi:hypothetical protein
MPMQSITGYAALAAVLAALACGGGKAQPEDTPEPDQAGAAAQRDTAAGETEAPPGYQGMERDTTVAPAGEQTATDTFLQQQGQGQPQDTAGYGGLERVDTTGAQTQTDTTGAAADDTTGMTGRDTSGMTGADTTTADPSSTDTTGLQQPETGDTTGYQPTQESRDTTNR